MALALLDRICMKKRKVEVVARHESSVIKGDRVYSDDGMKLEDTEHVGESTPDTDPETPPAPKPRAKSRRA
jgi:hypothetical protein